MKTINLSAAWVGMAGYDRPSLSSTIDNSLSELLSLPLGPKLKITTDIDLLPAAVTSRTDLDSVVVVVAGTGSIAMSYAKVDGVFRRVHRVGGWGHLLGDDGSGYGIGREALRTALYSSDLYRTHASKDPATTTRTLPPLSQAIIQHFKDLYPESKPEDLLSTILVPNPALHQAGDGALTATKRIAGVAKVVLSMADADDEAKCIVDASVSSFVNLVVMIIHSGGIDPSRSGLVLAGGMMEDELYRTTMTKALSAKCGTFKQTTNVAHPAVTGACYILSHML
jgi:N-acetylmuramic acid 6-phosphate etherase